MPNPTQPPNTDPATGTERSVVTALARECAEKIVKLTGFGHALHVNDIAPDIAATFRPVVEERDQLRAALAAAQQDTERLDWLASQSYYPHVHPKDGVFVVVSENVAPHGAFSLERDRDRKALRAAIDAARSHLPESGKPTP